MRRSWLCLAFVAVAGVTTGASGCDHNHGLPTTKDVRKAFADEGLTLVVDEDKAPWVHFLWYGTDGGDGERIAVFVFDEEAGAGDARQMAKRAPRWSNVSGVLVAQNVLVALLPPATPDDRRRALLAVNTLRNHR